LGLNELLRRELETVIEPAPTTRVLARITDSIVESLGVLRDENNLQKNRLMAAASAAGVAPIDLAGYYTGHCHRQRARVVAERHEGSCSALPQLCR